MNQKRSSTHPTSTQPRRSRRIHREGDPKRPGQSVCPACGAVDREGRWSWGDVSEEASERECPSCERIRQDRPAGLLRLSGGFFAAHRDEITARLRHVEERERREHPLKRIMDFVEEGGATVVRTTDAKLVEALGHALASAYHGRLELPPTTSEKENVVRASWSRD